MTWEGLPREATQEQRPGEVGREVTFWERVAQAGGTASAKAQRQAQGYPWKVTSFGSTRTSSGPPGGCGKLDVLTQEGGLWESLCVEPTCGETQLPEQGLAAAGLRKMLLFVLGPKVPFEFVLTLYMYCF